MRRHIVLLLCCLLALPAGLTKAQDAKPPLTGHTCADFDSQTWAQAVYDADKAGNPQMVPDASGRVCATLPPGFAPALWTTALPDGAEPATLRRVIDGDTIEVDRGGEVETVRM